MTWYHPPTRPTRNGLARDPIFRPAPLIGWFTDPGPGQPENRHGTTCSSHLWGRAAPTGSHARQQSNFHHGTGGMHLKQALADQSRFRGDTDAATIGVLTNCDSESTRSRRPRELRCGRFLEHPKNVARVRLRTSQVEDINSINSLYVWIRSPLDEPRNEVRVLPSSHYRPI